MRLIPWKSKKRETRREQDDVGLRRQTQVRRNLEEPVDEEPQTLELAVRADKDEPPAKMPDPPC
jgi:hypothetical protein